MDLFEIIGYACLGFLAVCYVVFLVAGMIALFPFGLIGFVGLLGVGVLIIKVVTERMSSKEDDYYSNNVEK